MPGNNLTNLFFRLQLDKTFKKAVVRNALIPLHRRGCEESESNAAHEEHQHSECVFIKILALKG